jgi:hypothetical protein
VEGGERRHPGQAGQGEVLGQVRADVVDDAIDPPLVLPARAAGRCLAARGAAAGRQARLPGLTAWLPARQSGQSSGG